MRSWNLGQLSRCDSRRSVGPRTPQVTRHRVNVSHDRNDVRFTRPHGDPGRLLRSVPSLQPTMPRTLLSVLLSTIVAGAAVGQCSSLATATLGGNAQNGAMFDVVNTSASSMNVVSFDQCFHAVG